MSAGKPTASPARFPYTEHRTMAEVMAEEALAADATALSDIRSKRTLCRACNTMRIDGCDYSLCPIGEREAA